MLRGTFQPDRLTGERYFRWRGGDVSRLEGLCDAVFALALTLLVVRLAVPQSLAEVLYALERAPVYLACFAFFIWVWYAHFQFHRRYGLEDALTVTFDAAIVFLVLLFVLPLRFFAELAYVDLVFGSIHQRDVRGQEAVSASGLELEMIDVARVDHLMAFYSGGFALIFGLYALQTWRAWRRREALELDTVEELITRHTIIRHAASSAVGGLALVLVVFGGAYGRWAGFLFFSMGPIQGLLGWRQGRRVAAAAPEL